MSLLTFHARISSGLHPHGIALLGSPGLKDHQEYDIQVTLSLPRSPPNLEHGNFMVTMHLLDSRTTVQKQTSQRQPPGTHGKPILLSSRRFALIPYRDPLVSLASRILFLFYHLMFPRTETCTLVIPMAERVNFASISTIPTSVYVEVEAGQSIQVYDASVTMTAQLRGLRWLMHRYRLSTFLAFTTLFWLCELLFMGIAWVSWNTFKNIGASHRRNLTLKEEGGIKNEGAQVDDLSDAPRMFPTYGRQPPLRYEPVVKEESHDKPAETQPAGAEADDEDDEDEDRLGTWREDSGIGTSYSEGGSGQVRRRTSHAR